MVVELVRVGLLPLRWTQQVNTDQIAPEEAQKCIKFSTSTICFDLSGGHQQLYIKIRGFAYERMPPVIALPLANVRLSEPPFEPVCENFVFFEANFSSVQLLGGSQQNKIPRSKGRKVTANQIKPVSELKGMKQKDLLGQR